jgi:uncharacterized protein HemX
MKTALGWILAVMLGLTAVGLALLQREQLTVTQRQLAAAHAAAEQQGATKLAEAKAEVTRATDALAQAKAGLADLDEAALNTRLATLKEQALKLQTELAFYDEHLPRAEEYWRALKPAAE